MKCVMFLTTKSLVIGCLCTAALAAVGCTDGRGVPTAPSANQALTTGTERAAGHGAGSSLSASPRSGSLHVEKECGEYSGLAGAFCTITSSSLEQIEAGTRIIYLKPLNGALLDSDVVLDLPGPGNNTAFGHCKLDLAGGPGLCTFEGGTGKFNHFHATVVVTHPGGANFEWDGTYSFDPKN